MNKVAITTSKIAGIGLGLGLILAGVPQSATAVQPSPPKTCFKAPVVSSTDPSGDVKNVFYDPMRHTNTVTYGSGPADLLSVTSKGCSATGSGPTTVTTNLKVKSLDKLTTYTVYLGKAPSASATKRVTSWSSSAGAYSTKFYRYDTAKKTWKLYATHTPSIVTNSDNTKTIVDSVQGSAQIVSASSRRVQSGRDSSYISTDSTAWSRSPLGPIR